MIKVAVNGAGRIGRAFIRLAQNHMDKLEIIALNDLGDIENIAYLLKFDTAYGPASFPVHVSDDKSKISINSKEANFFSEKDPTQLPWKDLGVDVVVESTGAFTTYEKARAHVTAGAKKVVITAPVKDDPKSGAEGTVLMGINDIALDKCEISSNASCTTNAGAPLIQILHEKIGVEKALLSTTHGYTASQSIVDGPNKKDLREGRAAAQNIVPTSTGAAIAVTKVITDLTNKFDGISIRVPIVAGSIADVTFLAKRNTTVEEVNQILREAAASERWQGIFATTDEKIVSSDIVGSLYGSIADLSMTRVVDGNLIKVLAWYDNEMGYTSTLLQHVIRTATQTK